MIPVYPLDEFERLPIKEKIRSLINVEGYAPTIKDVKPLGVLHAHGRFSEFEKALAKRQRKRKYSLLRQSSIATIVLLTGLFVITELIPTLLLQMEFVLTILMWICFAVLVTLVQRYISVEGIKQLDKEITERLLFEKEIIEAEKTRLMKIYLLERELREVPKSRVNRWLSEIFSSLKEKVVSQINAQLSRFGLSECSEDDINFAPLHEAQMRAKRDLISFLLQHKPIFIMILIYPPRIIKKIKSTRFKKEERKKLGT
jgi:hypothetical protein